MYTTLVVVNADEFPANPARVRGVPHIAATGQYRKNALHKERTDGATAFHEYRETVQTAEGPREAIVDVVDRQRGRARDFGLRIDPGRKQRLCKQAKKERHFRRQQSRCFSPVFRAFPDHAEKPRLL